MAGYGWADIADDLLFILAEKVIGFTSFVRFSAVCKPWYSVASSTKCKKLVPWLMLAEREGSDMRDFYDHTTTEVYQLPLPHLRNMKNLGFADGWLITGDEEGCYNLIEPLSGARIVLPLPMAFLDVSILSPKEVRDVLPIKATCSPIGSGGDCIVAMTHQGEPFFLLSFCRPTDKEWTRLEILGAREVAYVDGIFYTVTYFSKIYACDLNSTPNIITEIAHFPSGLFDTNDSNTSYIVECAGHIYIVVKIYKQIDIDIDLVDCFSHFRVFKLDAKENKVVEVKSIGNFALLLGTSQSFCLPITLYGKFFKRNCVYFTEIPLFAALGEVDVGNDLSVFDLEDGSLSTQTFGEARSFYSFPIWVNLDLQ